MSSPQEHRQFASLVVILVLVVAVVGLLWWSNGSWVALGLIVGFWTGHLDGRRAAGQLIMDWEVE